MRKPIGRRSFRRPAPHNNPVATAMATNRMRSHMRTVGIELFMTTDDEPAVGLVSHLAWIISMGAEIAANHVPRSDVAKRLHVVLRNLVQMATEGCRWRASLAEAIWSAALDAYELLKQYPNTGLAVLPAVDDLAGRIKAGIVRMQDVAGAEIYQPAAQPEGA